MYTTAVQRLQHQPFPCFRRRTWPPSSGENGLGGAEVSLWEGCMRRGGGGTPGEIKLLMCKHTCVSVCMCRKKKAKTETATIYVPSDFFFFFLKSSALRPNMCPNMCANFRQRIKQIMDKNNHSRHSVYCCDGKRLRVLAQRVGGVAALRRRRGPKKIYIHLNDSLRYWAKLI